MPGEVEEVAPMEQQGVPVVKIIGRIAGGTRTAEGEEAGTKILLHTGWTNKTYQVSARGLKVLRSMDIQVIDEPQDYSILGGPHAATTEAEAQEKAMTEPGRHRGHKRKP